MAVLRAVALVARVSETAVRAGVFELEAGDDPLPEAGRAGAAAAESRSSRSILRLSALLALVEPDERGDPMSPLRWTTKSLRSLAGELARGGHSVSAPTVGRLLREAGFSLQANAKMLEGKHPDRVSSETEIELVLVPGYDSSSSTKLVNPSVPPLGARGG